MVTDEYHALVAHSLRPALILVPPEHKLLFEGIAEVRATTFQTPAGLYYECYLLVAPDPEKPKHYRPIREALLLRHPEFVDLPDDYRSQKVEAWLMRTPRDEPLPCHFVEERLWKGCMVYVPDQFPKKYLIDEEPVSFREIVDPSLQCSL